MPRVKRKLAKKAEKKTRVKKALDDIVLLEVMEGWAIVGVTGRVKWNDPRLTELSGWTYAYDKTGAKIAIQYKEQNMARVDTTQKDRRTGKVWASRFESKGAEPIMDPMHFIVPVSVWDRMSLPSENEYGEVAP